MTFLEFFAGAGMARVGLGPRWQCAFANDIDAKKAVAYAHNWGKSGLVLADVARLKPSDLPGHANLAWASPPCQDVSEAGKGAGLAGERSGAFWPFWGLMLGLYEEKRAPKLIVIENVTGLMTSKGGRDFDAIWDTLADVGYRLGVVVIDAALFVPQSRERVFIIAVHASVHIPDRLITDAPMAPFHSRVSTAACARHHEPIWWRLPIPPPRNSTFADLIEDGSVAWNTPAETDRLIGMMNAAHLDKLAAAKRAGKRMVGGLYRRIRLEADGIKHQRAEVRFNDAAGCLRMPTGGSSRQTMMVVDAGSVRSRLLSPREAARLMGMPDEYKLPLNYNDAYGLMADGVVVPVVRYLAEHILEPLVKAAPSNGSEQTRSAERDGRRAAKENAHGRG